MESGELLLLIGDGAELNCWLSLDDGQDLSTELSSGLALLFGCFALAEFTVGMDGEEDQLASVFLESLDILLARLDGLVVTTTVN